MIIVYSKNKVPITIRLTIERWNHIIFRHPELVNEKERVVENIEKPELVQEGDFETFIAVKFYRETPLSNKYLIVIYKELDKKDGFIVTAYFINKPSERREIIWKR